MAYKDQDLRKLLEEQFPESSGTNFDQLTSSYRYENPVEDKKNKILFFDKPDVGYKRQGRHYSSRKDYSRTTRAEYCVLSWMLSELRAEGIKSELSYQEYIVLQQKPNPDSSDVFERNEFLVMRPDIALLSLGIVIEVDGDVHWKLKHRQQRDAKRYELYRKLGLELFVVENEQVYSTRHFRSFLDGVIKFIKDKRDSKNDRITRANRRKLLSRARQAVARTSHRYNLGTYSNKKDKRWGDIKLPASRCYGGYRFQF